MSVKGAPDDIALQNRVHNFCDVPKIWLASQNIVIFGSDIGLSRIRRQLPKSMMAYFVSELHGTNVSEIWTKLFIQQDAFENLQRGVSRLSFKLSSYQHRDAHDKDKTVPR